jgi:hypothetical protein
VFKSLEMAVQIPVVVVVVAIINMQVLALPADPA